MLLLLTNRQDRAGRPPTDPTRPKPLDRPLRALRGHADDRARRDRRERRAALDPGRPRLLAVEPGLGRERLPDRVRRPAAAGRAASATCSGARASSWPGWPSSRWPRCSAALSQSQAMLVGARFVQGVGGAMTSAVILGMIVTMFPEPREQAKAIGVYGFVASAGGSVGLLAGGVLTQSINWHWIFFINIPIGIATGVARHAPARARRGHRLRRRAPTSPARVLITSSLMLGVYTIVKPAAEHGWGSGRDAGLRRRLARAAGRVRRARGHGRATRSIPLRHLPLAQRLGRQRDPGAHRWPGCSACSSSASLYLQRVLGYDALADRPRVPARDAS